VRLALYEPDIPQNTGTILRLAACLGVAVDLIEPAGFVIGDKRMRRAGMDYLDHVEFVRHTSWKVFHQWVADQGYRLVLLTTRGATPHTDFEFTDKDILLLGRESAGVPDEVHAAADARIRIPISANLRSLNIAAAAAIALGEALRQVNGFPADSG